MQRTTPIIMVTIGIMNNKNIIIEFGIRLEVNPAPNMGLLTTPAAGATQGLTASPIRQTV